MKRRAAYSDLDAAYSQSCGQPWNGEGEFSADKNCLFVGCLPIVGEPVSCPAEIHCVFNWALNRLT